MTKDHIENELTKIMSTAFPRLDCNRIPGPDTQTDRQTERQTNTDIESSQIDRQTDI